MEDMNQGIQTTAEGTAQDQQHRQQRHRRENRVWLTLQTGTHRFLG